LTKRDLLRSAALAAITVTTAKAVPAQAQAKAEWPDIIEAKNIAEEGFIYGLPIVMNYAVMYEYSVDRNSGQFEAPFNQIRTRRASTPTRTSSPRTAIRPCSLMPVGVNSRRLSRGFGATVAMEFRSGSFCNANSLRRDIQFMPVWEASR
jgi:hypothetical protein